MIDTCLCVLLFNNYLYVNVYYQIKINSYIKCVYALCLCVLLLIKRNFDVTLFSQSLGIHYITSWLNTYLY